ncbi:uncharacterized protein [Diadema setosum]|uniref:uncharacterized protein n=1 Tax=Diadema setosum TaxID=31175 RepID=UPI003B3B0F95
MTTGVPILLLSAMLIVTIPEVFSSCDIPRVPAGIAYNFTYTVTKNESATEAGAKYRLDARNRTTIVFENIRSARVNGDPEMSDKYRQEFTQTPAVGETSAPRHLLTSCNVADHGTNLTEVSSGWDGRRSFRFNHSANLLSGKTYKITVLPFTTDRNPYYNITVVLNTTTQCSKPSAVPSSTKAPLSVAPPKIEETTNPDSNGLHVNPALLTGLLTVVVVLVVSLVAFICVSRRRMSSSEKAVFVRYPDEISTTYSCATKKDTYNLTNALGEDIDPILQNLEFDRSLLKIEDLLGSGQFGNVYKGFAYGINGKEMYIPVAVKSLKENATAAMKADFMDEIKLIVEIGGHPNILPIRGCCTADEPHYLITEFMEYGDLLHFLWKCREEKSILEDPIYRLTATSQLQIAIQIARGMEYLSTTMYYHGDLAARNVLVGEGLICKISDFGLADDIYQRGYKRLAPERKRPVKWVSLETNTQGKCSIQSDVWSFGIVLYEIYTLGGVPYPGMDGRSVIAQLQRGYRMERPSVCPEDIYDIMRRCWHESPQNRPSFTTLYNTLDLMLTERVDYLTEFETDLSHYEFVPCLDVDSGGSSCDMHDTTASGEWRPLRPVCQDLQMQRVESNGKLEYFAGQQMSHDSAFSEESALSGEPDHHLWWRLKSADGDTRTNSLHSAHFPSVEFIPIMDSDSASGFSSTESLRARIELLDSETPS